MSGLFRHRSRRLWLIASLTTLLGREFDVANKLDSGRSVGRNYHSPRLAEVAEGKRNVRVRLSPGDLNANSAFVVCYVAIVDHLKLSSTSRCESLGQNCFDAGTAREAK